MRTTRCVRGIDADGGEMQEPVSLRQGRAPNPLALLRFLARRSSVRLVAATLSAAGLNVGLRFVWSPWLVWGWPGVLLTGAVLLAMRRSRLAWVPAYLLLAELWANLWLLADDAGAHVRFGYALAADRVLGLGVLPSVSLQDWFYVSGEVSPLDVAMIVVYVSFFLAHQTALFALALIRPSLLGRYAVAFMATSYLALAVMFLVPTAPPWLAAETEVARVTHEVFSLAGGSTFETAAAAARVNEVAAMPSMHLAATLVVGIAALRANRRLVWFAAGYPLAMGVALVYLGEHYLVDVLAGAVLAYAGWRISDAVYGLRARLTGASALPEERLAREDEARAA